MEKPLKFCLMDSWQRFVMLSGILKLLALIVWHNRACALSIAFWVIVIRPFSILPEAVSNQIFNRTLIFHEFESFFCKAFRGAAVLMLPQAPDNAGNGLLGLTRRVKIFMLFCQITVCKVLPVISNSNRFTALNIIVKMKLHKNFHEMFGLERKVSNA